MENVKKRFIESTHLPPRLQFLFSQVCESLTPKKEPDSLTLNTLWQLYDEAAPWAGRDDSLAEFGMELLDSSFHYSLQRFGCAWLTFFPTAQSMSRLAEVALNEDRPQPVREQAVWSLGYRQSRRMPTSVRWDDAACNIADQALIELARRATDAKKIPFENLPLALRHVQSPEWFSLAASAIPLWGQALEAFADHRLASRILEELATIPQAHSLRAMRLGAATLGESAIPQLLSLAQRNVHNPLELRLLAVALGGEAQMPQLEEYLAPMKFTDDARKRAQWHLKNGGAVPTISGLKIARTTGLMDGAERASRCAEAADDIAALCDFQRHPETYLYDIWVEMVKGCNDLERARKLCAVRPEVRESLAELYLHDLARRGRARQVVASAQALGHVEEGAYWLAVYGQPFLALELAETSRFNNPKVAVARILGLYRAGRPDLALRVFTEELPPGELTDMTSLPSYPGEHEKWMAQHYPAFDAAQTALTCGMDDVLALGVSAYKDADADSLNFDALASLERWLARPIDGATVYLAGEFPGDTKERTAAAVLERGGRLVDGPFPGTHYYVMGLTCLVTIVAQLERQGTRRIRDEELGLSW